MKYPNTTRLMSILVLIATLSGVSVARATTPADWKDIGFSINADRMRLREVLNEFGVAYNVHLSISAKDQAVVNGRLKADSGSAFLDRLAHTHDFRWFVYGGTLYIVPRGDNASLRLDVGEDGVQDAKAALIGVGLFDARFGWGELPNEGVVLVNGPREYVNLTRDVLLAGEKKQASREWQVMIFRLKYASVSDRVITTRGEKETIPGIKSILNGLLGQDAPERSADGRDKIDVGSGKRSRAPKIDKGGGAESVADDDGAASSHAPKAKSAGREERPRIDADTSLNAIIIHDNASKRAMYEALIAQLDIEPQQIEIEALIVDIDRSRLSDLGIEWGVKSGNTSATVDSTGGASSGTNLPSPGSTMLISNASRFYAGLKELENNGDAHVLAKPTVLTLDNVAAVLDLSQTAYMPLVGERVASLANITAGTMLRVVPRVVREGASTRVRLEIDIEDGALGEPGVKANVTRSTISTQAIIDMQQTLMIGGYHSESRSLHRQKVPVLGDLPLVGGLFRSADQTNSTRERLFMITPRLAGSSGVAAAAAQSELALIARETALAARARTAGQAGADIAAPASDLPASAVPAMLPRLAGFTQQLQRGPRKPRCTMPPVRIDFGWAGNVL